jgi:2-oxoisovalerate dehydrogenase E1 component
MLKSKVNWQEVTRLVLLSRELDLLEEEVLAPEGKIKYQFSAKGHELSQVLLSLELDHPHDAASVYYRSRPFMLGCGMSPVTALAAGMALRNTLSQGRDTGVVYNLPRKIGLTVFPASGNVGAQFTPAVGWAQACIYHQNVLGDSTWDGALAVAHGGDGSIASNGFWSAINIASTLQLPMLFFIEDNQYGLSVPFEYQTPGGNIAENLTSFKNLRVIDADGTNPKTASDAIHSAVDHVRSGSGACLLRLNVPRLQGHTFIDDQTYKDPALITEEKRRDPLIQLKSYLSNQGIISAKSWAAIHASVKEQISEALEEAQQTQQPDPEGSTSFVFFDGTPPQQGGLRPQKVLPDLGNDLPQSGGPRINLVDAVRRTLETEMKINPRLLIFGEDVGVKGGVHGATRDMQAHFGVERVFDTSLSEEGIIGRSIGLALAGLLPVPEIQFRKYADPAYEQINNIGSIRWRTANNFAAPIVVRVPVGFGKTTGDPSHSVTGEAIYAHTLGWKIAFPSNAKDAVGLLRTSLRGDDPTFFLEHRALLDTAPGRRPYPGDDYCLPFGVAATLVKGDDLTVISWGETIHRCLEASKNFPGQVTVIDLRTIIPWDKETVLESVHYTGKVLIVHEDTLTAGFGAEISATIATEAFTDLDAPIQRLATPDIPIPYSVPMMDVVLPSVEKIRGTIQEMLAY